MSAHQASEAGSPSRKSSTAVKSEYDPLLPDTLEPSLYKTLSVSCPDGAGICAANVSKHSSALPRDNAEIENGEDEPAPAATGVYTTLSVLLLGVFISQTDQSFVLATYAAVSSEFDDLSAGSWLVSAYILAQCVAQPLYGRLSDIFGRKACLQTSYILFTVGTAVSGLGRSMGEVIAGRAIQGAGSAGMVSMVAIIVTDLVPLHEVASLWSYVNILQTTGRSCGGFIGGLLTQTLGWRWAFLIQVPPVILGLLLVQWRLQLPSRYDDAGQSKLDKLKRIDFAGAVFLCFAIFSACLVIDVGGQELPWDSPTLIGILITGILSAVFFVVSARRAAEPIFPLRLIAHYALATNYLIVLLQVMVQMSMMMGVPLYFTATEMANAAQAGAHIIPAFAGNAVGGLIAGYWIRKTGRYKWPTVAAPILSATSSLLCLTWDGNTSILQSLFIFPGGFAIGMISSSTFVGMAAAISPDDVAIAGSGMYLFFNLGAIAGTSAGAAVYQRALTANLRRVLQHSTDGDKIRMKLMEDVNYLRRLSEEVRRVVIPAYVQSFHQILTFGLACAALSFLVAIFSRGNRLTKK